MKRSVTDLMIELAERDASLARFLKTRSELINRNVREAAANAVAQAYWMGQRDLLTDVIEIAALKEKVD